MGFADLGVGRALRRGLFLGRPPDEVGNILLHTRHPPMRGESLLAFFAPATNSTGSVKPRID
jgi:hypothetical protein